LPAIGIVTSRSSLPSNCAAYLDIPERVDSVTSTRSWAFHTYGPFAATGAICGYGNSPPRCPIGPTHVYFSTPVRGAEVLRHVRITPAIALAVNDTSDESAEWYLQGQLTPRTTYTVTVDNGIVDVFGQRLPAGATFTFSTTSYTPQIRYPFGRMLVERPQRPLVRLDAAEVIRLFEAVYAEQILWRKTRGVSAREVGNVAAAPPRA